MKALERELENIRQHWADAGFEKEFKEAEDELKELRKDQSRLDWLASTEQNIGLRGMIDCAMSISSNN